MSAIHRWFLKWARTAHLYLTLFCLVLLCFFSITGLMLNHEDWFVSGESQVREEKATTSKALLEPLNKLAIVEWLRQEHGAVGELTAFEEEGDNYHIEFKRVGLGMQATIDRESGETELRYESRGLVGVLFDMHRAKSTGLVWSVLMDGVCIAVLFMSATGLVMWSSLRGRGKHGLLILFAGFAVTIGTWLFLMP
jgi:uncharacterized protein